MIQSAIAEGFPVELLNLVLACRLMDDGDGNVLQMS